MYFLIRLDLPDVDAILAFIVLHEGHSTQVQQPCPPLQIFALPCIEALVMGVAHELHGKSARNWLGVKYVLGTSSTLVEKSWSSSQIKSSTSIVVVHLGCCSLR